MTAELLRRAAAELRSNAATDGLDDFGLAVADWLDSVDRAGRHEVNGADIHNALAVARAYLGEDA